MRPRTLGTVAAILATCVVLALSVAVFDLTTNNRAERAEKKELQEQLDASNALLSETQKTLGRLIHRQRQLERFIRRHGFTPPPDTQGQSSTSGSQTPQNGSGDNGGSDGPSKPPKPSPEPTPPPEDCIAEILGTCV